MEKEISDSLIFRIHT